MTRNTLEDFKEYLGYDGHKIDEEKALEILSQIGIQAANELGETPLIIAAYLGRTNVLKKIIEQIDDVDYTVPNTFTESALLSACNQRRLESIRMLVEAGADLEQENRFNQTPLAAIFVNTFSDPIPCARYLVSVGAKITERVIKMGRSWNREKFDKFLDEVS